MVSGLGSERGDDNISAVLTWAALLLVVWAVLQVVVIALGRNVALDAARAGLAEGRLPPVDAAAARQEAVERAAAATTGWLSNVDAQVSSDGESVTVTVTADAASLVPFATWSISQTASGPIEQLVGPP